MVKVATSLLLNNKGKLLTLKRSDKLKIYKGLWLD